MQSLISHYNLRRLVRQSGIFLSSYFLKQISDFTQTITSLPFNLDSNKTYQTQHTRLSSVFQERDCFYYTVIQTDELWLHSTRHKWGGEPKARAHHDWMPHCRLRARAPVLRPVVGLATVELQFACGIIWADVMCAPTHSYAPYINAKKHRMHDSNGCCYTAWCNTRSCVHTSTDRQIGRQIDR